MYTRLETGSRGGEGPFFNTMLKNLIRIKNSFPGFSNSGLPRSMLVCLFVFSFFHLVHFS